MTTRQTGIRCRATATDLYAACLAGAQKELATLEYMEQLKRPILSFEASAERHDGTVVPFSLRVYEPELDEKLGNFCFIECPFIRQRPFRIFGVDQEQACELSVKFINWDARV